MNLKDEILSAAWGKLEELGFKPELGKSAAEFELACGRYARACYNNTPNKPIPPKPIFQEFKRK